MKLHSQILQKYDYGYQQTDVIGNLVNNGQLAEITSHIGSQKQWTQKFNYDAVGRLSESEEKHCDTNALSYKQKLEFCTSYLCLKLVLPQ